MQCEMAEECTVVRFSRDPSTVRIESLKNIDVPFKFTENNQEFGLFYVICIALSILTYIVDISLVCILLYYYSINEQGAYFAVTLTFVLVPALFMTTFSLRWYIVDHDDPSIGKTSVLQWVIRIIFLLLQVSPVLRYVDTLYYGIKSKVAKSAGLDQLHTNYFRRMLDEDTNGALLRLFHCFLHSAPQSIIQLMILLQHISNGKDINKDIATYQAWTVLVALLSIAWALTSYHRSVRYARDDKENITWVATLIAFCWHLMSAVSRVVALSLLAAVYPAWMGVVCALHWAVMAIWLALEHLTSSCGNRCEELLLSIALGLAYVLAFISPKVGPTRYVYLAYYLVCFMENTAALVVWCVANNSLENPILYYGAPSAQLIAFLLTITFLLIYYRFCHPSTAGSKKILEITDPTELDKPGFSKSYTHRSFS